MKGVSDCYRKYRKKMCKEENICKHGATQLLEDFKGCYLRLYIFLNIRLRKVEYKNDEQDYLKTHL